MLLVFTDWIQRLRCGSSRFGACLDRPLADDKPGKSGGSIVLAEDDGLLTGVIAFNVNDRDTGQHIAIETRTMVNPHLQGDVLVFQVRRILKPHLRDTPPTPGEVPDPTDIVEMTATRSAEGKAILACAQCGSATQMELVKQQ